MENMEETHRPPTPASKEEAAAKRSLLTGACTLALAVSLASVGSCSVQTTDPGGLMTGGVVTAGGDTAGPALSGAPSGGPSVVPLPSPGQPPGMPGGPGQGPGAVVTPGGSSSSTPPGPSAGMTPSTPSSSMGGGGMSSMPESCEDAEPPPDPEWPEANCARWANETDACGEAWFAEYCDVSCGRCIPEGGPIEPEPEPCEDVEPPPDPEWPEANCSRWANETESCGEDWFAEYCDVSCGRCIPEGGPAEPEPEVCEDVQPPEDPEWPGATCAEWANETTSCGEDWFAEYCDVSCGRCIPEGGLPEQPMGVDCSGEGLPNVTGGEGFATRYWDCCQTHCSQFNGQRCGQDGTSNTGDSNSACNGGGSFACYREAPYAVTDCLSYGHIAKANPNCGSCYRIQFTGEGEHNANDPGSLLIKGKQMIVKVTNTGSDVGGNQFDLMVPGGGVGQFNACSRQWGVSELGAQYGGFLTNCTGSHAAKKECVRQECMKIPEGDARDGCIWFVDWLEVADNPKFTSQQTDCPF